MAEKKEDTTTDNWTMGIQAVKIDLRRAIIGGAISFAVILLSTWLLDQVTGSEAYQIFKHTLPATRSLTGTFLLALGNILALMLTLLSVSASMNVEIKWTHYERVKQISMIVAYVLIICVFGLLLLNIPITESEKPDGQWFLYIYYAMLIFSSFLGGAFITVALLLYNTVKNIIGVLNPEQPHALNIDEEE